MVRRGAFIVIGCGVVLAMSVSPLHAAAADVLRVVRGQSRIEVMPGARQVAVGDASIAGVKVISGGRELMITGLREGMTTLDVWHRSEKKRFLVRVLRHDPRTIADDLQQILADIPGVRVQIVGERVMLTGQALTGSDLQRIRTVAKLYPEVLDFVADNAVDMAQLVRVRVAIVDINRSRAHELGLSWPDAIGGEVAVQADQPTGRLWEPFGGTIALTSSLTASVHLLMTNGAGRVLASPTLVARNGAEAVFHAGGQIPVPVATGLGQTSVQWQPYGVELRVTPHVDPHGNFDLDLSVAVSDLDPGNAVATDAGTIPAMRTRRTSSRVNLAEGESLVLSELVDRREGKTIGRVPGLGHIPIVGGLFRTRSVRRQEGETYVILTPSVLRPGSLEPGEAQAPLERYRSAEPDVRPSVIE